MTTLQLLQDLREKIFLPWCCPMKSHNGIPSNRELRQWLSDSAVIINGEKPKPEDQISLPINELVFFPNGKRKTTLR